MHAREWSCDRTVAGRGSLPGLVYHTFTPLLWGLLRGLYNIVLLEVHSLAIMIKQNSPVRCSYFLTIQDITVTFGGHSAVISGRHRRPAFRPCPQGARRASHCWSMCRKVQGHIHSVESPGVQCSWCWQQDVILVAKPQLQ